MKHSREQLGIDPEKCTGCLRCALACAMKGHDRLNPRLAKIKVLAFFAPDLNVPVVCMACDEAPCMKVCPVNARRREKNETVTTDEDRCIGCRACLYICPTACPTINPYTGWSMTCDMCQEDESGPWCASACDEGALRVIENSSLAFEPARKQAEVLRNLYPGAKLLWKS